MELICRRTSQKDPLCENRDVPEEACFDTVSANLAHDIGEAKDLAPKEPKRIAELSSLWTEWMRSK